MLDISYDVQTRKQFFINDMNFYPIEEPSLNSIAAVEY